MIEIDQKALDPANLKLQSQEELIRIIQAQQFNCDELSKKLKQALQVNSSLAKDHQHYDSNLSRLEKKLKELNKLTLETKEPWREVLIRHIEHCYHNDKGTWLERGVLGIPDREWYHLDAELKSRDVFLRCFEEYD